VYKGFWWGNLRHIDYPEESVVDVKIIFRWILSKWDVRYGLDRSGSG
jgi:hypothetical protein